MDLSFAVAKTIYFEDCFTTVLCLSEVLLLTKQHSLDNLLNKPNT